MEHWGVTGQWGIPATLPPTCHTPGLDVRCMVVTDPAKESGKYDLQAYHISPED